MPGWGPASESGGGSEETFSSSLLFRQAALGFRFLSAGLEQKAISDADTLTPHRAVHLKPTNRGVIRSAAVTG